MMGAEVLSDEGAGLGAARQLGASQAKTDWVAYVDSDTEITADTLSALIDVAERNHYDAVQAELRTRAAHPTYWQRGEIWRRRMQEQPGESSVIGCQATLVRRALLEAVPFDSAFPGAAEDHDWCFRAVASGAKLAHTDRAIAFHDDRPSFAEFARQRMWYGRGMARLLVRHRRLAPQIRSATVGLARTPEYLPFMAASWALTAVGLGSELLGLRLSPKRWRALVTRPSAHQFRTADREAASSQDRPPLGTD